MMIKYGERHFKELLTLELGETFFLGRAIFFGALITEWHVRLNNEICLPRFQKTTGLIDWLTLAGTVKLSTRPGGLRDTSDHLLPIYFAARHQDFM